VNINRYERKGQSTADGSDKIVGGVEDVDHDKAAKTGMALSSDAIATDVDARIDPSKMSVEAFMAEELLITLHDRSHESEPNFVELNVNGDYRLLMRDSQLEQRVKRYHVALLAQAKTAIVTQKPHTDNEGFQSFREQVKLRLSYPFSVAHDPAGMKGRDWLRPLLTSANA
jgi:hypothetical protein